LRILHLTESVGFHSGGLGTIALALAAQQRALGHEAEIWSGDTADVARRRADEIGLPVTAIVPVGPAAWKFSPQGLRNARTAAFDVVHQHGIWTMQSQVTNIFRGRGVPTIVAPQGSLEDWSLRRSRWKKRIALTFYERANLSRSCLQATTAAELESFRRFGLRNEVAILPNGVESRWLTTPASPARFRERHGLPAGKRIVLFLSRIHPKKGLPLLIEALAGMRESLDGWVVVIAGMDEGGHRREVEAAAAESGVADLVLFVGEVHGEEKREAYAAADLFVLPTHSDNFAIVVTEALASGVPVLTTHGAPWREIATARAGWWIPVDVASLRAALADAIALPPASLREMGERGRNLVRERYTWEAVANDAVALYEWLARRGERPSFVVE
jgi:glycosyltransferase involved in cell wall biosynthesis